MSRPRFSDREGRLLLAAVHQMQRADPNDEELVRLKMKLARAFGSEEEQQLARAATQIGVGSFR